jgi:dipeptidyl aminopeptidase/acylaminoacyl peptidase
MIYSISGAKVTKKPVTECEDVLSKVSPINYVKSNTVPTLLCHGMKDDVVPYSNATALFELLKKHGVAVELITFQNSGHGLEADSDKSNYADEVFYRYVDEYLK